MSGPARPARPLVRAAGRPPGRAPTCATRSPGARPTRCASWSTRSAWARASGCSTWAAARAATPRRWPGGASRWSGSTSRSGSSTWPAQRRPRRAPRFERLDARELPFDAEFDAVISLCQGAFGLAGRDRAGPTPRPAGARPRRRRSWPAWPGPCAPGAALAVSAFSAYFQVRYLEDDRRLRRRSRASTTSAPRSRTRTGDEADPRPVDLVLHPRELRLLAGQAGLDARGTSGR